MDRYLSYFASDVHLGLQVEDPAGREKRFVAFLRGLPAETENLFLLGDVWDFWYEYRDVVPKGYVQVLAALEDLMERGVNVYFFQGNHDVWTFHYFEELGMKRLVQPCRITLGDKVFCLGHGDGLGPVPGSYLLMRTVFHSKVCQWLFSLLHPRIAYAIGNGWSRHNRLARHEEYHFRGPGEPLYQFATEYAALHRVDYFVFGHYHDAVDLPLEGGARLILLKDWIASSPYLVFDRRCGELTLR